MFWDNYVKLCTKAGESPNAIAKKLDISSGSVTNWKNGAIPHDSTLQKIADHFEVPVATLKITGSAFRGSRQKYGLKAEKNTPAALRAAGMRRIINTNNEQNAFNEEEIFLSYFRKLNKSEKQEIIAKMAFMSANNKKF